MNLLILSWQCVWRVNTVQYSPVTLAQRDPVYRSRVLQLTRVNGTSWILSVLLRVQCTCKFVVMVYNSR